MNDLWNLVPTNPPVSVTELTGAEMWEMLEENLEHTFSVDPYAQMGGYVKRCLGLNVYFKIENPRGTRVQQIFVQGEPLDKQRAYTVAFITTQGVPTQYGCNRRTLEVCAIDALKAYLTKHERINPRLSEAVVAV